MKYIVVLEDVYTRVKWLETLVGDRAVVKYANNVRSFLKEMAGTPDYQIVLVFMDHDLGVGALSDNERSPLVQLYLEEDICKDINGEDGRDAAKKIETKAPIVVWSMNNTLGPEMTKIMCDRGLSAAWVNFGNLETLRKMINFALD